MLVKNCQYFQSIVDDSAVLPLYDESEGHFSAQCMQCVMNLDNLNVANHRIGPVIQEALKLTEREPNRIPSRQTIDNIINAKTAVASIHLSRVLPDKKDTTLYTDETSKFGKAYNVYAVTDDNKTPYLLGLREMSSKSAKTALDTFKEILSDISSVQQSKAGERILTQISNTMSDRAATETAFNRILSEYRSDFLPAVTENWNSLNSAEKEALSKMNKKNY